MLPIPLTQRDTFAAPDEMQLIKDYRELTPPGKEYIRQTMALAKVSYCEKNYPLSDLEEAN